MKSKKLILFLLCGCIFAAPSLTAHAATPILDKYGALAPTAASVGEMVSVSGGNLSLDTTFKFRGGVLATDTRFIDPAIDGGTIDPNRILVTVPKGALTGRIQVCNDNKCVLTKEKLSIISSPASRASIRLSSSHNSVTYKSTDVVQVKYKTKQWRNEDVFIYLEQHHPTQTLKKKTPASTQLVGQTSNKKSFEFALNSLQHGESGTGDNIFKIKVCNLRCDVSATSDRYFSIRE